MSPEQQSILELAECVKELVRIIKCFPNFRRLEGTSLDRRLDDCYGKATLAKDRVHGHY